MTGITAIQPFNKSVYLGPYPNTKTLSYYPIKNIFPTGQKALELLSYDIVHFIKLDENFDFQKLKNFIATLPPNIHGITFAEGAEINILSLEQRIELLKSFPSTVMYLNFGHCNFFGGLTFAETKHVLKSLPDSVKYLGWYLQLREFNTKELIALLYAVPSTVLVASALSNFSSKSDAELLDIFHSLKFELSQTTPILFNEGVLMLTFNAELDQRTTLNLEGMLSRFHEEAAQTVASRLLNLVGKKPRIEEIDLRGFPLQKGLKSILPELPKNIKKLAATIDLDIDKYDPLEIFEVIGDNINELVLEIRVGYTSSLDLEKLITALKTLPPNVATLDLHVLLTPSEFRNTVVKQSSVIISQTWMNIAANIPRSIKHLTINSDALSIEQISSIVTKISSDKIQRITVIGSREAYKSMNDIEIEHLIQIQRDAIAKRISIEFPRETVYDIQHAMARKFGSLDYAELYFRVMNIIEPLPQAKQPDGDTLSDLLFANKTEIKSFDLDMVFEKEHLSGDPSASILRGIYFTKALERLRGDEISNEQNKVLGVHYDEEQEVTLANKAFLSYLNAIKLYPDLAAYVLPLIFHLKLVTPLLLPRNEWTQRYFSEESNELLSKINNYLEREEFNKTFEGKGWNPAPINNMSDAQLMHQLDLIFKEKQATFDDLNKVHDILDIAKTDGKQDLKTQVFAYLKTADLNVLDGIIGSDDLEQKPSNQILLRLQDHKPHRKLSH